MVSYAVSKEYSWHIKFSNKKSKELDKAKWIRNNKIHEMTF